MRRLGRENRRERHAAIRVFEVGHLWVGCASICRDADVIVDEKPVHLTPNEFKLSARAREALCPPPHPPPKKKQKDPP